MVNNTSKNQGEQRIREIEVFLEQHGVEYTLYRVKNKQDWMTPDAWTRRGLTRCKNIFLRNHKGNRHFLVLLDYYKKLDVEAMEQYIGRGKLTFASDWRLRKYLNLEAGVVSVFGLLHDRQKHVEVLMDEELRNRDLTFLPNCRGAFIGLTFDGVLHLLRLTGHAYTLLPLARTPG